MECHLLLLVAVLFVGVCVGEHSVSILTDPSQGPFRIGQTVQFSCVVEPTPSEPVDYQWRIVDHVYYNSRVFPRTQSFSRSFSVYSLDYHPHYCYYLCEASVNGTLLGSASRIVEVQGFLYTEEPVVRSFTSGGNLVLGVNTTDIDQHVNTSYISSLVWYHNGTEIVSGTKYSISNNGTRLRITNMAGSDAGSYEVKIGSISYNGTTSSMHCDSIILPLMELRAAFAPVTFMVQEECVPSYDPSSIITTVYINENISFGRLELSAPVQSTSPLAMVTKYHKWYRNGVEIADDIVHCSPLSLQIDYNNTHDVVGDYLGILKIATAFIDSEWRATCGTYYSYFQEFHDLFLFSFFIPVTIAFWRIKAFIPPSSVLLHFEVPVLSVLETTTVECTAVGGGPSEDFNVVLWRNEELVASGNGRNLSHMITPSQYGTYRCSVGSIDSTTIILKERASLQLLMGGSLLCLQDEVMDDIKTALIELLGQLCQTCDSLSPEDIVDVNCTVLGRSTHLTASLVYSTPDGRITASTLLNMLTAWLLTEDNPTLMVAGTPVTLSNHSLSSNVCVQWLCPTGHCEGEANASAVSTEAAAPTSAPLETITPASVPSEDNGSTLSIETTFSSLETSGHISASAPPPEDGGGSTICIKATPAPCEATDKAAIILAGFFAGVIAGTVITVALTLLILCVKRMKFLNAKLLLSQPFETRKCAEIPLDSNQPYESVDAHYQTGMLGKMQEEEGIRTNI